MIKQSDMKQYIDKAALVAELEKRIAEGEKVAKELPSSAIMGLIQAYKNTLSFLNTLEAKEVNTIEREVKVDAGGYPFIEATELYDYENDKPLAKAGDKVKVVFIKDK